MKAKRVFLIVLDSCGAGELPDAADYGDVGSNTLGNTAQAVGGLKLPNFEKAGLGKITPIKGLSSEVKGGVFGKAAERSCGKDTTTGHWEITGIVSEKPFPTYPHGFPDDLLQKFIEQTGRGVLGNKVASGTAIIEELGAEHLATGKVIVYTSADSVFQIAAHEAIVPVNELYDMCEIARGLCSGEHAVGRVIARPFEGEVGAFHRTDRRRDFSLEPPYNLLDALKSADRTVYGVGKIEDIFCFRGLTDSRHTHNNQETLDCVSELLDTEFEGLVFANCVDFDMLYGHRNDAAGYAAALEKVDEWLGENLAKLRSGDIMLITADHGCDPTTVSTDHSREYIPLVLFGPDLPSGVDLGIRNTFADIAASIAEWLDLKNFVCVGKPFEI